MYKVLKDKGYGKVVSLENTDKKIITNIGVSSVQIRKILEDVGHISIDEITTDEWNFEVNKETAEELVKLSMPMRKPIRNQKKIVEKKSNKEIDAMDVLLGLANYN